MLKMSFYDGTLNREKAKELIEKTKKEKTTQFILWVRQVLTEIRATGKYYN